MTAGFNLTDQSDVFKINYYKKSFTLLSTENVLEGRIRKLHNFTGKQRNPMTSMSFSGGVGSGLLPKVSGGIYKQPVITAKKMYATCSIEREAIKASANDEGAFRRATKETVFKNVQSCSRNRSRVLFNDGSGVLGGGDAGATAADVTGLGTVASPYLVYFPNSTDLWKEANWEEQDYVQMVTSGTPEGGDAETNLLLVVEVAPATRCVSLVGTSAILAALVALPGPLLAANEICMQRSYNKDPMGLKGILTPAAGVTSLYGVDIQRRWEAGYASDEGGRGITTDMMNQCVLTIGNKMGQKNTPKMIFANYIQYMNMLSLLEDQKVYTIGNRNLVKGKELVGKFGFQGVEYMTPSGPVGIFLDRFIEDDRIYFINDNYIEQHHRPGWGWFDDDGTVFLRSQDEDNYDARYGGYYENFIVPSAHGVIYGLATV